MVVPARRASPRRPARSRPTTTRRRSEPSARSPVGEAIGRLAARADRPVVFIALHGPFGEDGTVQALLEAVDLPYTGSGVAASAIGMDKAIFKRLCRGIGLPVVDWREVRSERWASDPDAVRTELDAFAAGAGDPRLMVKPARLGSSVGMTLVHEAAELPAALDLAFAYDTLALVETYVAGARDLEVSVIGNDPVRFELYGPGEVVAGHEFYDYAAKYTPGLSESTTTAEVTTAQRAALLQDRARLLSRHRRRGVRARRLPVGRRGHLPVRDEHDPGVHADLAVPDASGGRRSHLRGRVRPRGRPGRRATRGSGTSPPAARGPAPVKDRRPARRHRTTGAGRRTRPVRRASGRITPVRVMAALIVVLMVGTVYGATASSAFDYRQLRLDGASYTKGADVEAALARVRGANLFTVQTAPLEDDLKTLTTVADAHIDVELPDTLAVTLEEREPILVWAVGDRSFLVDGKGTLFASRPRRPAGRGGRPPGRRRSPDDVRGDRRRLHPRPGRPRCVDPGSPRSCRATSAAGRTG